MDLNETGHGADRESDKRSDGQSQKQSLKREDEKEELDEARKLRRLQVMMSLVMSVISQDPDLTLEAAIEMSVNARKAALAMFPDKELAYDILWRPRLKRLMNERFRLQ